MKRKLLILLSITALCVFAVSSLIVKIVRAESTGTVAATVTAIIYSVSLDNGDGIAFGAIGIGSSADTTTAGTHDTTTATNNGSVAEKLNIKAVDSTGGAGWTLGANPGSEIYGLNWCITTCDTTPVWFSVGVSPSYAELSASVAKGGTQLFDLQVETPTVTTVTDQQAITVTIQAVAP